MKTLATLLLLPLGGFQSPAFEVRGVCAIDASTVACWAPDGGPRPGLADEVRRGVEAREAVLSYVPGRKNRFVVLRHARYESLSLGGEWHLQILPLDSEAALQTSVLRVATPPGAAAANVALTVGRVEGAAVDVPFRAGVKAVVEGVPIEIGAVGENPGGGNGLFGGYSGPGPFVWGRWRFPLQTGETTSTGGFRIEALGGDGKPILYVDPEGRPVEPKRGEALWKEATTPGKPWSVPPARPAGISFWSGQPFGWAGLAVDPKAIRALRISRVVQRPESLGPFALDPNP